MDRREELTLRIEELDTEEFYFFYEYRKNKTWREKVSHLRRMADTIQAKGLLEDELKELNK
jgi:hypothetical protein